MKVIIEASTYYTREVLSCVKNCLGKCYCNNKNEKNYSERIDQIKYMLQVPENCKIKFILKMKSFFTLREGILFNLVTVDKLHLLF